ncbi:Lysine-specific histone demethylase 1A, partial [Lunasporangiospora selenospora]
KELALHSDKVQTTILEARNRLGGRVATLYKQPGDDFDGDYLPRSSSSSPPHQDPLVIHSAKVNGKDAATIHHDKTSKPMTCFDLGASWIHGVHPDNPLTSLAKSAGIEYIHTDSDIMFTTPGGVPLSVEISNRYWSLVWDIFDRAREYAIDNRETIPESYSFLDWLRQFLKDQPTKQKKDNNDPKDVDQDLNEDKDKTDDMGMDEVDKQMVLKLAKYWADENAIPLDQVSMKYIDAEEIFDGDHSLVTNGFDRCVDVLAREAALSIVQDKNLDGEHGNGTVQEMNEPEYGDESSQIKVYLENVVERIEYDNTEVRVFTSTGQSSNQQLFRADVVLVTLPLGVLKHTHKNIFYPALPERKQLAINRLGFGSMLKILIRFPTCFWPREQHFINFLPLVGPTATPSNQSYPCKKLVSAFGLNDRQVEALTEYLSDLANYSSLMPVTSEPILIGYATNRAAELIECLSNDEAQMMYLCHLAHYFENVFSPLECIPSLVSAATTGLLPQSASWPSWWPRSKAVMTRWHQDSFAFGSYTSIPIHATLQDLEAFETPVAALATTATSTSNVLAVDVDEAGDCSQVARIHFAGEHTTSTRFASVHGALMSGQREALKIVSTL